MYSELLIVYRCLTFRGFPHGLLHLIKKKDSPILASTCMSHSNVVGLLSLDQSWNFWVPHNGKPNQAHLIGKGFSLVSLTDYKL